MKEDNVLDKLQKLVDEAEKVENFKLAKELGQIALDLIEERSREWANGYDTGYGLAIKEIDIRRMKAK